MKKIRSFLIVVMTLGTFVSSGQNKDSIWLAREQRYRAVPFIAAFSYGSHSLPLSVLTAHRPRNSDIGFFFGGVVGEMFAAKTGQRDLYRYTKTAHDYVFAGLAYSLKNVSFGIGAEFQGGVKKGESGEFQTMAGRAYLKWVFPRSTFFATSNLFGRQFQCLGYYTTMLNNCMDIGVYGNSSVSGIGPLIKFGGKKLLFRPFGFSVGYHPTQNNFSATFMFAR
jgi:hypothetical protein